VCVCVCVCVILCYELQRYATILSEGERERGREGERERGREGEREGKRERDEPLIHIGGHRRVDNFPVGVEYERKESIEDEEWDRGDVEELVLGKHRRQLRVEYHEHRRRGQHAIHLYTTLER
jgi:hypothetical protein